MTPDPFENEHQLRQQLDAYSVEVPDFPRKRNRLDRLLRFLTKPAANPVEPIIGRDTVAVSYALLLALPALLLWPVLFLL